MTIDDDKLDEIERCAEAATDGSWEPRYSPKSSQPTQVWQVCRTDDSDDMVTNYVRSSEDVAHIATADPPTVLALVREVRRLREVLQKISNSRAGDFRTINLLTLHVVKLAESALEDTDE